ncbi:threonyl-tRNA synthetase [Bacillus velezensis]|nr:His/Gly/Thr/Pro-type tRNA ligase C-terminal domain-containing protein [Bacillus velezensis]QCT30046.1 threonyl-tRNA synthetase [Bacillus velezensis]
MNANFFRSGYSQKKAGIRAEIDERDEKLGYKIREAQIRQYGRENTFEENVSDFISRIIREAKQKIEI